MTNEKIVYQITISVTLAIVFYLGPHFLLGKPLNPGYAISATLGVGGIYILVSKFWALLATWKEYIHHIKHIRSVHAFFPFTNPVSTGQTKHINKWLGSVSDARDLHSLTERVNLREINEEDKDTLNSLFLTTDIESPLQSWWQIYALDKWHANTRAKRRQMSLSDLDTKTTMEYINKLPTVYNGLNKKSRAVCVVLPDSKNVFSILSEQGRTKMLLRNTQGKVLSYVLFTGAKVDITKSVQQDVMSIQIHHQALLISLGAL